MRLYITITACRSSLVSYLGPKVWISYVSMDLVIHLKDWGSHPSRPQAGSGVSAEPIAAAALSPDLTPAPALVLAPPSPAAWPGVEIAGTHPARPLNNIQTYHLYYH